MFLSLPLGVALFGQVVLTNGGTITATIVKKSVAKLAIHDQPYP